MKRKFDTNKIADLIRQLIIELGDNPSREGLIDTPNRVADMYSELLEGMLYTNDEIASKYNKCFACDSKDLVLVKNIECFSYCEHHLALMYNMNINIAYIPNGKVLGLSKIARIADMVCKRLQLQEKIGNDLAQIMSKVCNTKDVCILIDAKHSCMTARGIKNINSTTRTVVFRGSFEKDITLQQQVCNLINN